MIDARDIEWEASMVSSDITVRSRHVAGLLLAATGGRMPAPAGCTGPDGELAYSWDRGRHHLEVEFVPGGPTEWFWRDRETEQIGGADQADGGPIPAEVVALLANFYPDVEATP